MYALVSYNGVSKNKHPQVIKCPREKKTDFETGCDLKGHTGGSTLWEGYT